VAHLKLTILLAAVVAMAYGCSTTEIKSPSGWEYRSTRFLNAMGVDETTIDPSTGAVTIKGVRSDSQKALETIDKTLEKLP
jgi:hypothetical protein